MFTETFMYYIPRGSDDPKPDREKYIAACFILNEEVVDIKAFNIDFFNLFNDSVISEQEELANGEVIVNFTKVDGSVTQVQMSERRAAIVLSDPLFVRVPDDKPWVHLRDIYKDGEFSRLSPVPEKPQLN